jgi:hypothetical protein
MATHIATAFAAQFPQKYSHCKKKPQMMAIDGAYDRMKRPKSRNHTVVRLWFLRHRLLPLVVRRMSPLR